MFLLFTLLWVLWLSKRWPNRWMPFAVMLAGILFGMVLEVLQGAVFENRSSSPVDMVADAIGCMGGLIISRKYAFN